MTISNFTPPSAPLFTVVMPCFQARETIAVAVASVCAQTERDFELIIVDDGSPDDAALVAQLAAAGDPRVRVYRRTNAGPAASRNFGVAAGTGKYIAFLDSDDRWAPDVLARHRAHFEARGLLGVSFGRVRFFDPTLTVPGRCSAHVGTLGLMQALGENPTCTTSNIAVRRCVFERTGGFATQLTHAEDQEWLVRVLTTTHYDIMGIDAVLVDYRMSPSGLSADLGRMRDGWEAMIASARQANPKDVRRVEASARALFYRYLARRALRTGQSPVQALDLLVRAFWHGACTLLACDLRRTVLTVLGAVAATILPLPAIRQAVAR